MEKKRTQRIIGILIVISLIVIMLPLIFGKSGNPPIHQATVKAPPPEQEPNWPVEDAKSTTVNSTAAAASGIQPVATALNEATTTTTTVTTTATVVPANNDAPVKTEAKASAKPMTDAALLAAKQVAAAETSQKSATTENDSILVKPSDPSGKDNNAAVKAPTNAKSITINEDGSLVAEPAKKVANPETKTPTATPPTNPKKLKTITAVASKAVNKHNAWLVQMGCFKVKANAARLAVKLRQAGFNVITAEKGNGTRVYIGPSNKKEVAVALSHHVNATLSLSGIVVPYKSIES